MGPDVLGKRELWHLRPELEFTHCVDSWNVRAEPSLDATVVFVLRGGQHFAILDKDGDWVQIRDERGCTGWCFRKFNDVDALTPIVKEVSTLDTGYAPPPSSPIRQRSGSCEQRVCDLLTELGERRRAMEECTAEQAASSDLVRRASDVQATMAKLEFLGVPGEQLLAVEGSEALTAQRMESFVAELQRELVRKTSFQHSDFSNPEQDSCWLSTFFQSLWHSRVFHALFDGLVRPLPSSGPVTASSALRTTWSMYERAAASGQPVPVKALVEAWGTGYGDSAEAFGKLQSEEALGPMAEQIALVPVPFAGSTLTPEQLWASIREAGDGVARKPLIVVDLALPPLPSASILTQTLALVPRAGGVAGGGSQIAADLGEDHHVVAMICYMDTFEHYVVFCRRQTQPNEWLFFNDLPGLASGALRELRGWAAVAHECARFELRPKVLLYESVLGAERAISNATPSVQASIEAAAEASSAAKDQGGLRDHVMRGAGAVLLAVVLALVVQQLLEIGVILGR